MISSNSLIEKINIIRSHIDFMTKNERDSINSILDSYVVNLTDFKMTDSDEVIFENKDYNLTKRFFFNRFFNTTYKHSLIDKIKIRSEFYLNLVNRADEDNFYFINWLYDREIIYTEQLSVIRSEFEQLIYNFVPLWMLNTYISIAKKYQNQTRNLQIPNIQKDLLHDEYYNIIMSEFETALNHIVEENYNKTQIYATSK